VLCKDRAQLINFLSAQGIQTRPFYPCLDTAEHLGISSQFQNSRIYGEQGLVLPCGPEQPFENIDRVLETLRLFKG